MKRCRLIYRSVRNAELLPNNDLRELVEKASENNAKDGITGMLLLSGDHFLQVLEGPVKFVNQLYAKIITDERHYDVELIHYESVNDTYFDDWSMEMLNLGKGLSDEMRDAMLVKYSEENGHIKIPDDLLHVHALLLDARWGLLDYG